MLLTVVSFAQSAGSSSSRRNNQTDNQSVESQSFGENQDQDHTDKQSCLLGVSSDTGISDNSDSHTCSERTHTNGQSSTQVSISSISTIFGRCVQFFVNDDSCDKTVN